MSIIRENEYMTVFTATVEVKDIDFVAVEAAIKNYLANNTICEENYKFYRFYEDTDTRIEFGLKRVGEGLYNNGHIDEDFDSDDKFDKFCENMKNELELRSFGVPYWYYPK